jgi:alpha-amylase/alpha-mannosidase (GH57 family)
MPFNSDTYFGNKCRRYAWQYLAEAREIRRRAATGDALALSHLDRIPNLVALARNSMRLYRLISYRPKRPNRLK